MSLTLYYAPISCALVPYIALTEAGADFDVQPLNFRRGDHLQPQFLALNPRHRVPVLVIDGEPLTENVAIQLWIAQRFPSARLLPDGEMARAQAHSLLAWCASGIHPTLTPNALPQRYCDLPGSEDSVRRCAQQLLLENLAVAEDRLRGREWFFEHFTLPDIYFFWCFRRAQMFKVDVTSFAACGAHFARMSERASVRQLLDFERRTLAAQEA